MKTGRSEDKIEVGVFDETAESVLILWGTLTACVSSWQPFKTSNIPE